MHREVDAHLIELAIYTGDGITMWLRLHILPFVLLSILPLLACSDKGATPVNSLQPGGTPATYTYRAYNLKGALVVSGTMVLTQTDSTGISGTWSLTLQLAGEQVGPQFGTGTLAGNRNQSSISINLNPGWADNNVFLNGTVGPNGISGQWEWSTFVGTSAHGSFEAIPAAMTM